MKKRRKWGEIGRRAAALVLAAVLLLCQQLAGTQAILAASVETWDGVSRSIPATDENGVFMIGTGAELAWFADQVNSGNTAIHGRLTKDIYLNGFVDDTANAWMMIGSEEHPFRGTFDGNGCAVQLLYAEITDENEDVRYAGLFGVIDGGKVFDLQVGGKILSGSGASLLIPEETRYDETYIGTGGVAGYLKSGEISGCTSLVRTAMDGEPMYRNAGGIAGICSGSVTRCTFNGKISTDVRMAQNHVGGIAGLATGSDAVIRYCGNLGPVQGYFTVGGIAGSVRYGASVLNCYNYGTVSGVDTLGGIAGSINQTGIYSDGSEKQSVIRNVYNLGDIEGIEGRNATGVGGIVGWMGYERWTENELPPRPVVENAYSVCLYEPGALWQRGAIVGILKSGTLGNVYGLTGSGLDIYGERDEKNVSYSGTALMVTEQELKSADMIKNLGSAFIKTSIYDADTGGYPKLAFQEQTTDVAELVDEAVKELNGWLSEENQVKYGTAYSQIESAVGKYLGMLGSVVTEEDLDSVMAEAREVLNGIKPGTESDEELMDAIDQGVAEIQAYRDKILSEHEEYTEEEIQKIRDSAASSIEAIQSAPTVEEAEALVKTAEEKLDAIVNEIAEAGQMDSIRAAARYQLETYRSDEELTEEWKEKVDAAREEGYAAIDAAENRAAVAEALNAAKQSIDRILDQIPTAGAWDGETLAEPAQTDGVYQIATGAELAWFANAVNNGNGGISAVLCGNISLGNHNWTPIGGTDTVFRGSFDGNGYAVRGLYIESGDTYAGLFGRVYGGENQTIKNLTVSGVINCPEDIDYGGGIVGYISGENASSRNSVVNCHSQVEVTLNKVTISGSSAGGIAGYAKNTWFRQCSNSGSVVIASEGKGGIRYYAGGILGTADADVSLRQSVNRGYVEAAYCAGGLAGIVKGGTCEFTSNYNSGQAAAKNYAGGLAGQIDSAAAGGVFSWAYTSGAVNLNQSGVYAGALFGYVPDGAYEDLYALSGTASSIAGRTEGGSAPGDFLSATELSGEDTLNALNGGGSYFIKDYMGRNGGCPMLVWELTLEDFRSGAIGDLQTFVKAEDYTEENWALVQEIIAGGIERIQAASTMDGINSILTETKAAVFEIDSIADSQEQELEAAKEAALTELASYKDFSLYREAQKRQLEEYLANGQKAIRQADTLEEVARELADAKWNMDQVATDDQMTYEENCQAAAAVTAYIDQIGEVSLTAQCKALIDRARGAYDALTPEQQELVENYQTLLDAEAEYQRLLEESEVTPDDREAAAAVDALIVAIGEVTLDSGDAIRGARYAYEGLTDKQKNLVSTLSVLEAAEAAYDGLRAREASAVIASIGEVSLDSLPAIQKAQTLYDALTEGQKALVTNYQQLLDASARYTNLVAAAPVMELIGAIGEVTLDSGAAITQAVNAYNALTGEQQALVENYYLLEQAYSRYQDLYAADRVQTMISQIGAVSGSSGPMLQQIRAAYDALTESQRALVSNLSVLENAEAAYAALQRGDTTGEREPGVTGTGTVPTGSGGNGAPSSGTASGAATGTASGVAGGGTGTGSGNAAADGTGNATEDPRGESAGGDISGTEISGSADSEMPEETRMKDIAEERATEKKRLRVIRILAAVLGIVGAAAAVFGISLKAAARQRKNKMVHY